MERVQLFATCLGDLAVPGCGRRRRDAAPRGRLSTSSSRPRRCAAASRRSTRATARPPAGSPGRSRARSRARRRSSVPSGSCATMASHYLPELLGVEPFDVWELSAFLDAAERPVPRRNEGTRRRLPRLLPHAARAADRRAHRAGCSSAPAPSSSRCRGRISAAASAARSRCASPRSRSRWPTTSSPARRRRRRSSRPIPAASCTCAAARSTSGRGVRVVHLATALARGVDA